MATILIKGLSGGAREVEIDPTVSDKFDLQLQLESKLADLTYELLDARLISKEREPDKKIKIYLCFSGEELLLCCYNGRLLCDLDTEMLDRSKLAKFGFLEGDYFDAYDLIFDVIDYQKSEKLSILDDLNDLIDVLNYPDGSVYKGDIKDGSPHGHGFMNWIDGSSYVGDWIDGYIHGKGTYIWADGGKYEGDWVKGQMHGTGRFQSATGVIQEGLFTEGRFEPM